MYPRRQGKVGQAPERFTSSLACEEEVRHVPEGGGGNFVQDTEGGTTSVACEEETPISGCLTFDPGGMPKITWSSKLVQVSESNRSTRGDPSSDPSKEPTG